MSFNELCRAYVVEFRSSWHAYVYSISMQGELVFSLFLRSFDDLCKVYVVGLRSALQACVYLISGQGPLELSSFPKELQ